MPRAAIIGRAGPIIGVVWIVLIAAVVVLIALVSAGGVGWTRDGVTSFLNRRPRRCWSSRAVGFGLISGRLPALVGDLRQGIPLDAWPGATTARRRVARTCTSSCSTAIPAPTSSTTPSTSTTAPSLDALAERGFTVAADSHSDYLWTHVSVPSALNLAYVEQIPEMPRSSRVARHGSRRCATPSRDNEAFDVAREHGYDTVAVASGFEEVAPRQADVYVDCGNLNEFEISLLTSTFTGAVVNAVAPDFGSGQLRERIPANLDACPQIAATRDRPPALVFAHVPAPHQPVVLGDDGEPVVVPLTDAWFADSPGERGEDHEEFVERYRAQLPYLNAADPRDDRRHRRELRGPAGHRPLRRPRLRVGRRLEPTDPGRGRSRPPPRAHRQLLRRAHAGARGRLPGRHLAGRPVPAAVRRLLSAPITDRAVRRRRTSGGQRRRIPE